jgi:hypothetical protein
VARNRRKYFFHFDSGPHFSSRHKHLHRNLPQSELALSPAGDGSAAIICSMPPDNE